VGRFSFALPFVFRYLFPLSFVIYSLCLSLFIPLVRLTSSSDRPGRSANGELATCRHGADCGREKLLKMSTGMIYIGRMRV